MLKKPTRHSKLLNIRKIIAVSICVSSIVTSAKLSIAATLDEPYHRAPCCEDGSCVPNRKTYGYHKTTWTPWPEAESQSAVQKSQPPLNNIPTKDIPTPKRELDAPPPLVSPYTTPNPNSKPTGQSPSTPAPTDPSLLPRFENQVPGQTLDPLNPTNPRSSSATPMSYQLDSNSKDPAKPSEFKPTKWDATKNSRLEISTPKNTIENPFTIKGVESSNGSLPTDEQPAPSKTLRPIRSTPMLKLFDNNVKFRNSGTDSQPVPTPEDLEPIENRDLSKKEPMRINLETARNVLNIQEPEQIAPAPAAKRLSLNNAPFNSSPVTSQPVQQANFNSGGHENQVKTTTHQTPLWLDNQNANNYAPAPSVMIPMRNNEPNQFESAQPAQTPSPNAPAVSNELIIRSASLKSAPVMSSSSANPLRGMSSSNPLRKN